VLASVDLSGTMRQGLILGLRHPRVAAKSFVRQLKAFTSEKWAREMDDALHTRPLTKEFEGLGGYLAPMKDPFTLMKREEAFMSKMAERVPFVRRSERAYITYLNELRVGAYEATAPVWRTLGAGKRDLAGLAKFINAASGRGNLTPQLERYAPLLNTMFFSPRLQLSRLQLPAMLLSKNPYVRGEAWKAIGTFVGAGTALLSLLSLHPDVDVETDPRSADFGKIKIGDTRLDIWTGYLQYARFISQMLTGERKTSYGNMTKAERDQLVWRFAQSKFSPAMGLITDLMRGETYMGEEIVGPTADIGRQFRNRLVPLFIQDMLDTFEAQGANGLLYATPGMLGVGVLTYTSELSRARDKAARAVGVEQWEDLDPLTQEKLERTDPDLQVALVQFDRQVMGTQWGDWRLAGRAIESMFTDVVERASAEYDATGDGNQFREKVNKAFDARRGAYAARQKDSRFAEIIARMETSDEREGILLMGPEQAAITAYEQALYGDDMYDEFGNYRFDEAERRRVLLRQQLGEELYNYVEEYRGLREEHLPPIYHEYRRAQVVLRPYWQVKNDVYRIYGKPKTPYHERVLDRIISRIRRRMLKANPEMAKYHEMFYTGS